MGISFAKCQEARQVKKYFYVQSGSFNLLIHNDLGATHTYCKDHQFHFVQWV
jgi:hypothetical protein